MGNEQAKKADNKPLALSKKEHTKLSSKDYKFLTQQTGLTKEKVDEIFKKFNDGNPDGKLDKKEFVSLYNKLRPEPADKLDEISEFVFRAFDSDKNGYLSFTEFIMAYALTSRGDLSTKLNYAFDLYDADGNGFLTSTEVRSIIHAMLDMLGAQRNGNDEKNLAEECIKQLDSNHDGKVTKDEFIQGLMSNYSLRALMSPFN